MVVGKLAFICISVIQRKCWLSPRNMKYQNRKGGDQTKTADDDIWYRVLTNHQYFLSPPPPAVVASTADIFQQFVSCLKTGYFVLVLKLAGLKLAGCRFACNKPQEGWELPRLIGTFRNSLNLPQRLYVHADPPETRIR